MKKYNNNYSVAETIFNNILEWAANKNPSKTKEQVCVDIEKILDLVEDRYGNYKRGYESGYRDAELESKHTCCREN